MTLCSAMWTYHIPFILFFFLTFIRRKSVKLRRHLIVLIVFLSSGWHPSLEPDGETLCDLAPWSETVRRSFSTSTLAPQVGQIVSCFSHLIFRPGLQKVIRFIVQSKIQISVSSNLWMLSVAFSTIRSASCEDSSRPDCSALHRCLQLYFKLFVLRSVWVDWQLMMTCGAVHTNMFY